MTANLIRGRVVGEGVKDIVLDKNQSLKVVQCDEDGEVLGDRTPIKMQLVDGDGNTLTDDVNDALKVTLAGSLGGVDPLVATIIDNATFNQTITSADIDLSNYDNFIVSFKTGTATDSPTLTISLNTKDSNGNYVPDSDYISQTITTATSGIAFKGFLEAILTGQIVCTFGGTGSFASVTVELQAKKI